jgi:hypothetical protein
VRDCACDPWRNRYQNTRLNATAATWEVRYFAADGAPGHDGENAVIVETNAKYGKTGQPPIRRRRVVCSSPGAASQTPSPSSHAAAGLIPIPPTVCARVAL